MLLAPPPPCLHLEARRLHPSVLCSVLHRRLPPPHRRRFSRHPACGSDRSTSRGTACTPGGSARYRCGRADTKRTRTECSPQPLTTRLCAAALPPADWLPTSTHSTAAHHAGRFLSAHTRALLPCMILLRLPFLLPTTAAPQSAGCSYSQGGLARNASLRALDVSSNAIFQRVPRGGGAGVAQEKKPDIRARRPRRPLRFELPFRCPSNPTALSASASACCVRASAFTFFRESSPSSHLLAGPPRTHLRPVRQPHTRVHPYPGQRHQPHHRRGAARPRGRARVQQAEGALFFCRENKLKKGSEQRTAAAAADVLLLRLMLLLPRLLRLAAARACVLLQVGSYCTR